MNLRLSSLLGFLCLCLSLMAAFPAFAEEAPVASSQPQEEPPQAQHPKINPPTRVLPSKIKPVRDEPDEIAKAAPTSEIEAEDTVVDPETLALYATQEQGALAPDVLKGASRGEIAKALVDVSLPYPSLYDVQKRLVLTSLDLASLKKEQATPEQTLPDLFTLRLSALIQMGAFDEALALYKKNEGAPPSSAAAMRGVEAMVSTGRAALACLETKALDDSLKQENADFWTEADTFCKSLLSPAADNEDDSVRLANGARIFLSAIVQPPVESLENLNSLSVFRVIALQQTGALVNLPADLKAISGVSPKMLSLILRQPMATPAQYLPFLSVAAERGTLSSEEVTAKFTDFYTANPAPHSGRWKDFLTLYMSVQTSPLPATLQALLSKKNAAGLGVLLPLADHYKTLPPESFNQEEARTVLRLLIMVRSDSESLTPWVRRGYDIPLSATESGPEKTSENQTDKDVSNGYSDLLSVWMDDSLLEKVKTLQKGKKSTKPEKDSASGEDSSPSTAEKSQASKMALSLALKPFLDGPVAKSEKKKIYDNVLSLTGSGNYVMPSDELLDSLQKATASQQTGRVVLYSFLILNGHGPDEVHPAALFKVLEAYESVGLSEETSSLALDALLGLTKEKKEK